mmetsp:Transcript_16815/g.58811  ORF Transcript_16815/g.58811 Transcript_16815/m.58811 type:complete len:259 (+) Transcript_16815:977-1753(+)
MSCTTASVCRARSCVGDSTMMRTPAPRRSEPPASSASRRASSAVLKAPVLPVPLCACATTSRPARNGWIASDCTGDGRSNPYANTPRSTAGLSPMSSKLSVASSQFVRSSPSAPVSSGAPPSAAPLSRSAAAADGRGVSKSSAAPAVVATTAAAASAARVDPVPVDAQSPSPKEVVVFAARNMTCPVEPNRAPRTLAAASGTPPRGMPTSIQRPSSHHPKQGGGFRTVETGDRVTPNRQVLGVYHPWGVPPSARRGAT